MGFQLPEFWTIYGQKRKISGEKGHTNGENTLNMTELFWVVKNIFSWTTKKCAQIFQREKTAWEKTERTLELYSPLSGVKIGVNLFVGKIN